MFQLIQDLFRPYRWREMHILILVSGLMFYVGGFMCSVLLLQTYYPPSGAILFWSIFIWLSANSAAVDYVRKH